MELGPLQKEWVKSLREHPERQISTILGEKYSDGSYKACCLGELHICNSRMNGDLLKYCNNEMRDGDTDYLEDSWDKYGLIDSKGSFANPQFLEKVNHGALYHSLAEANDDGVDWLTIANFIESNPEEVFTKSV